MKTHDYYFDLPEHLIAQFPAERRGDDRLLLLDKYTGEFEDHMMSDFSDLIPDNSVLVVNNSKVRKARCYGVAETGGVVEFLFLGENDDHTWTAMVTKSRKQKVGKKYEFRDKNDESVVVAHAEIVSINEDGTRNVGFEEEIGHDFFTRCGHVPLPPYIKREDKFSDETRYQTIYAKKEGSVAAPTAGLHFTPEIMAKVKARGIQVYEVTLHVGAGTFLPVRSENIEDHHMHTEYFEIAPEVMEALNKAKAEGKLITSVGTTSIRTLESAADESGRLVRQSGKTDIFIHPGYKFKFVDNLLTNFHTPESTLLMLVSALAGKDEIFRAYQHAIDKEYRFFSYGDAMYIRG